MVSYHRQYAQEEKTRYARYSKKNAIILTVAIFKKSHSSKTNSSNPTEEIPKKIPKKRDRKANPW